MPTNVRTDNKDLVTQVAGGTVVQSIDPVLLKPKGDPGVAPHVNSSVVINNAAGTVFNKNGKVATKDSYMGAGKHAPIVIIGRNVPQVNGDNSFTTWMKNVYIERRNAVMHGVKTGVNSLWNLLPAGVKTAVENGTQIAGGMTLKDFGDAAQEDAAAMMDALMSTDTLIALAQTAALMGISAIPVVGQLAGGAAAVQRLRSAIGAVDGAATELKEMMDRWSKPMSPAQLAAERKKLASFLIRVGVSAILAALGKAMGKLSPKSIGRKNSEKEVQVGVKDAPKQTSCACAIGSPVIVATGEKSLVDEDFSLSGPIELEWRRSYRSGDARCGWFGQGWSMPLSVMVLLSAEGLTYQDKSGRDISLPALAVGGEYFDAYEQFTLKHPSIDTWQITFKDGRTEDFLRGRDDLFALPLAAVSDRNSNQLLLHFPDVPDDPFTPWRPHSFTDSAGRRVVLTWGYNGLLENVSVHSTKDVRAQQLASYTYSEAGDLIAHTDANGARRTYEWRNNILAAYTKADGARYCAEYDQFSPFGRVVFSYAEQDGRGLRFQYEDLARSTTVIDALGRSTIYHYDERKDVVAIVGTDGVRVKTPFDANGNPRGIVDPLGRQTSYRFDERGNLAEVINAAGARTLIDYNTMDLPVKVTDALNHTWLREYDTRGNLATVTNPLLQATRFINDLHGKPVNVTDPRGGIKKLQWNDQGDLALYTDCSGQTTSFSYDELGRLVSRTDALGNTAKFSWDNVGNLLEMAEPGGTHHYYEWSAEGRLLAYTDPLGFVTRYHYNVHGQLARRNDANGHTLGYEYDETGRLIHLINENGDKTTFRYDIADQLTDEIGCDGRHLRYCYNAAGELTHLIEGGGSQYGPGKVIHYERDALGQLIAKSSLGEVGCEIKYAYDALGRLISADNASAKISYAYDPVGQLLSESQILPGGQARTLTHTYDELGNRIKTAMPNSRSLHWLFYGAGHLHQINFEMDGTHQTISDIERDALHREKIRSQGALESRFDYDPMGRLTRHRATPFAGAEAGDQEKYQSIRVDRSYRYDALGNLVTKLDALHGNQAYRYDAVGQILSSTGRQDEFFEFDPAGNLRSPQPNSGAHQIKGNRLAAYGDLRFEYDVFGNVITRQNGAYEQAHFEWNSDHQLTRATVTRHGVTQTTLYEYDALGRRTKKTDAFGATEYLWDGNVLLESQRGQKSSLFIFEPLGFVPLATIQDGKIYWYQCDQIGTPQELTDAKGNITWAADYKIWGTAVLRNGSDSFVDTASSIFVPSVILDQPFRFQGQQYDDETGLHYNRFRYYDPAVGRFISEDPIRLEGGNNLYRYGSNPLVWIDPLGLAPCRPCRADPCGIAAHGRQPSPRPSDMESHHGIQDAWAKARIGKAGNYTSYGGPAILLDNKSHDIVNNLQNARRDARVAAGQPKWGTSIREEFENSSKDLRAGGVSDKCRKRMLKKAYNHFYNGKITP
ncbi:RHS repeat-associated core domain-containing protein [Massilia scottii]|uniref:RHS repeat-associated core domain-containing protein n=1 Tax=Massilia scottii TaxID=3057166 RepID=UPI0027965557|nr:RHS repeat-associated core domain-containing protein [Massilia sp. CCM 9029]MDQ1835216.1 RHS repeat-associated core domain-containing protein [Massilia sp. CCM 9029]